MGPPFPPKPPNCFTDTERIKLAQASEKFIPGLEATTEAVRVADEAQESQLSENLPVGAAAAVAACHCPVVACSFRASHGVPPFHVGQTLFGPWAHAKGIFGLSCGTIPAALPTGGPGHALSTPRGGAMLANNGNL